jgi:hypothetical protein
MPIDRMTQFRAAELAGLPALGIHLPEAVTTALASYQAAMRLPVPPRPEPYVADQALAGLAATLVRDAPPGELAELAADVTAIGAARQAAQDAEDRAALAAAIRDAAAVLVCQVMTGDTAAQVTAAIQAKYGGAVKDLTSRAARLPAGITTETALTAGGATREHLLKVRDLLAELTALRAALIHVEGPGAESLARGDGLGVCVRWERTGRLYRDHWLSAIETTRAGDLGGEAFWLAYAALPGLVWWCPTMREAADRAAELEAQYHTERIQGAMAR